VTLFNPVPVLFSFFPFLSLSYDNLMLERHEVTTAEDTPPVPTRCPSREPCSQRKICIKKKIVRERHQQVKGIDNKRSKKVNG